MTVPQCAAFVAGNSQRTIDGITAERAERYVLKLTFSNFTSFIDAFKLHWIFLRYNQSTHLMIFVIFV